MKSDSAAAKKLSALLKKLKSTYTPDTPPASEPVTQLAVAFLQWRATTQQAEDAFARLMAELVDINELRVSHDDELVTILGEDYPDVHERIARLREALNEIYVREHAVAAHSIANAGKKEQRAYLDSLPGMTPYVAASVTLISFGGHAMPVDEKLVEMLVDQKILEEPADCQEVEAQLLRQIKANDALEAHMLFQAWADDHKPPRKTKKSTKKKTKRTSKTKTAKTGTSKRTTKRAASARARKK